MKKFKQILCPKLGQVTKFLILKEVKFRTELNKLVEEIIFLAKNEKNSEFVIYNNV